MIISLFLLACALRKHDMLQVSTVANETAANGTQQQKPNCTEGGCNQIAAIEPSCDGGNCDQTSATRASCNGGKCNQSKVNDFATCDGGYCDQSGAEKAFCTFSCTQSDAREATCEHHSCKQDGVHLNAYCYGGYCDQTLAGRSSDGANTGYVQCLGGHCNQKDAQRILACDGGMCLGKSCSEDRDCGTGFKCDTSGETPLCRRVKCSEAQVSGFTNGLPDAVVRHDITLTVDFSFICASGKCGADGLCVNATIIGATTWALSIRGSWRNATVF